MTMVLVIWHVQSDTGLPLADAVVRGDGGALGQWAATTDCAGNAITSLTPGAYHVTFEARGYETGGYPAATIAECGTITKALTRVGLAPVDPLALPTMRGAFCVPDALPGIPYGDGRRIWTPAFGCYSVDWQIRILDALVRRGHTWCSYQLSGRPYHDDYPALDTNVARILDDLDLIRRAGLRTLVSFDDTRGTDCTYLTEIARETQDLVDGVMGIYESNGVFAEPDGSYSAATYAKVESVLRQQATLWPHALNCFHSTAQNNGARGFGEADFWTRMAPIVHTYLYQTEGWAQDRATVMDRLYDFTERLMGGHAGWPVLRGGVCLYEAFTSQTYRGMSEADGAREIDAMMTYPLAHADGSPRPEAWHPRGYMDGGTIAV